MVSDVPVIYKKDQIHGAAFPYSRSEFNSELEIAVISQLEEINADYCKSRKCRGWIVHAFTLMVSTQS